MARTTPRVERETLVLPVGRNAAPVLVGSQQWYHWLAAEENASFFFTDEAGSFTARKERRKRGGWYWIAYRSRGGKLLKTYIGRSENLTSERLREVTQQLGSQQTDSRPPIASSSLATGRFIPPPLSTRSGIIERTELLVRLDECLRVALLLVTAPAGFGKTTLLNMWYTRQQHHDEAVLAWLSLDERDNDAVRFWPAVWNALCNEPGSDNKYLALPLYQTPQMSWEAVMAALLSTIGNTISKYRKHVVLILDDYHIITNPQIHAGMEFLLAHIPPSVHLILSSRSEPPFSLGRARMYGELLELRPDDLRLSADESDRFLRETVGVTLSPTEQATLQRRTEGWIAGLHLAGLALRGQQKPGDVLERFNGSQRSLFDYFAEEVLARQPAEVQQFLLSTAPLHTFTPQLCAAVLTEEMTSDSEVRARTLLAHCERANLFIVLLDEQQQSYRYHALFREFLRTRLEQNSPERISELHRRASNWYEQRGQLEDAIEHALIAGESERTRDLIEMIGEEILWRKGEVQQLLTWIQRLPASNEGRPRLEILYAWALLLSGQHNLGEVEELVERLESREDAIGQERHGEILALRARIAGFRKDGSLGATLARQALQELPKEKALLRADVAFGLGSSQDQDEAYRVLSEALHLSQSLGSLRTAMFASRYLAQICIEQGRLTEAENILRQALQSTGTSEHEGEAPASGIVHTGLAEVLYERNDLTAALHHARLGVKLGEQSGEIKVILYGCCILAQIFAARGEYEQGWQEIQKAERVATWGQVPWLSELIAANAVQLALLQRDAEGAKRALRKIGIEPDHGMDELPAIEQRSERLTLARLWLAEEKYREVEQLLEPLIQAAQQEKRVKTALVALALKTIALEASQDARKRQQAPLLLSEALRQGAPERYIRTFVDIGEGLARILPKVTLPGSAKGYLRQLQEAYGGKDARNRYAGLSEREYEVLQLVAQGLSNQEIAETLFVAISTVKVHVRHICQKLAVQKRIQAIAKAREVGLL
jgi:LuxR family maltose regulon positive regulatory protein